MGQPRQAGQKGRGGETDMKSGKCVEWCQKLSLFYGKMLLHIFIKISNQVVRYPGGEGDESVVSDSLRPCGR